MRLILLTFGVVALLAMAPSTYTPEGRWITYNDTTGLAQSVVEIRFNPQKKTWEGVVVKILPSPYYNQDPKCEKCTGTSKNKPVKGMQVIWDFKPDGDRWEGKLLDPGNGGVFEGAMWMKGKDVLMVRGYWGLFYRTQRWVRDQG